VHDGDVIKARGRAFELIRHLDHHIGRAGDEIMRLQQPIDRSFRDKVLLLVGEAHSQPPRRQLRNLQCQRDDLAADIIGM
jgi:hypothetical protein